MNETQAGEPACARHPKVVTYLTCASCGKAICPACFVSSPVGYKCRDCGLVKHQAGGALSLPRAVGVGLLGLTTGVLAAILGGWLGFFALFLAMPFGQFVGHLILLASGRNSGRLLEILTGASIVLGGLALMLLPVLLLSAAPRQPGAGVDPHSLMLYLRVSFGPILSVIATAAAAVSRIKNLWWR